jgi:hypothetical protein
LNLMYKLCVCMLLDTNYVFYAVVMGELTHYYFC